MIPDQSGNFYGAASFDANYQEPCCGLVFQLSPAPGGTLTETVLYSFRGASDGEYPSSGLTLDQGGHFYGVTGMGGNAACQGGCGIVYEVSIGAFTLFSPAAVSFADQTISFSSGTQNVILTNNGNRLLTISSIQITGASSTEFSQQNNCPATLPVNASCTVSVTFSPNVLGTASASLTVTDNATGSPQSVPLTGTGVIDVSFSPTTVTFPSQYVGTSGLPQAVTLTNNTNSAITIKGVSSSPSDFAALNSCPDTLQPGGYCTVGVFFDPTASGTRNGILIVTDNAPTGQQTVQLTGVGQDFSMLSSSPSASVAPGQMATYNVEIEPAGGFNQTVALSCTGAPIDSTCSVSPSSVKLSGSGTVPATITVATAGGSAALFTPSAFARRSIVALWLAFAGFPGLVLVGTGTKRRRALLRAIVLFCLISGTVMWTSCGGGGSGSGAATPAGSYNLTVVGTFSSGPANLVHSTKLTLVVQ